MKIEEWGGVGKTSFDGVVIIWQRLDLEGWPMLIMRGDHGSLIGGVSVVDNGIRINLSDTEDYSHAMLVAVAETFAALAEVATRKDVTL